MSAAVGKTSGRRVSVHDGRMDAAITVGRLSPATRDDYLAFFDHERGPAFADNPEWATCYCQF